MLQKRKSQRGDKMKKAILVLAIVSLLMLSTAAAQLSVQLKRTNPGIAKEKNAELIFDIVNTDLSHQVTGFLWCKSPDDAIISSTYGVGSGSGAQYISPKFTMDEGPSQEAMTLTVNADSPGDKRTGCYVKYIPFKVTFVESIELVEETTIETVIDEETGKETLIEVVEIVQKLVKTEVRQYLKLNGKYVDTAEDRDYREIRLDKTIPFIAQGATSDPKCPEGQVSCTSDEIDLGAAGKIPKWVVLVIALVVVLLVVYLLGKTSRRD